MRRQAVPSIQVEYVPAAGTSTVASTVAEPLGVTTVWSDGFPTHPGKRAGAERDERRVRGVGGQRSSRRGSPRPRRSCGRGRSRGRPTAPGRSPSGMCRSTVSGTGRGTLPDVVPLPSQDEAVRGARAALDRRAPEHERPVGEEIRVAEPVDVGVVAGRDDRAVGERHLADAELRCALGIELAQEVADAVGLVLRHQRRALAGEQLADLLQLDQLASRGDPRRAVAENVRVENRRGEDADQDPAGNRVAALGEDRAGEQRERDQERARGRERLPGQPGELSRSRKSAATTTVAATSGSRMRLCPTA